MKFEKIAPGLMTAFEDYQREGRSGLGRHTQSLGVLSAEDSPKPPRAVVFIHCDPQVSLQHLADYRIRVNQPAGRVRTAFLPVESLEPLSEEPTVQRIVPSRYMRLLMDVAPDKVNLPTFRTSSGLSGSGVIIGVVDTGIDPKHPAFAGRILRIWDQVLPGPGVVEGDYGVELTESLLTVSRDTHGHGTHVAGIAAGADAVFGGVAPEAELVIVKTDLQDAHVADAVRYIFRVARELDRPAVVNLSLGGHDDAHDGSDSLSQIIDGESGPGQIVCCAAGNEGDNNIHAQTVVGHGRQRTLRFQVPGSSGFDAISAVFLNGWYSGGDQMRVAVQSPGGFQTPYQNVITDGPPWKTYNLPDCRVRIVTPGPDLSNGDHNFWIEVFHPSDPLLPVTPGIWRLRLRGKSVVDGRVDIWALDSSQGLDVVFTGKSVADSFKIGSPGAAASAITVASYNTKVRWTDVDGVPQEVGRDLDEISEFSSEGPLRNNAQKPDVAAPGSMIAAPLSADSSVSGRYVVASGYRVNGGTSMASPFITGVVALLLQDNRMLDPQQIKAFLRQHSLIPDQPAGTFDPKWGFGLINLPAMPRSPEPAGESGAIEQNVSQGWVRIGNVRLPIRRPF
jgi:subtilisin family serine protease